MIYFLFYLILLLNYNILYYLASENKGIPNYTDLYEKQLLNVYDCVKGSQNSRIFNAASSHRNEEISSPWFAPIYRVNRQSCDRD